MMDSRTRFRRTYRFEPVDRFFVAHMGHWPETLAVWRAQGLNCEAERHIHANDRWGDIGIELGSAYRAPFWPRFDRQIVEQTDAYTIERDEFGRTKKWLADGRRELAQYLRFPVQNWADWQAVQSRLDATDEDRFAGLAGAVAQHGARDNRDYPVGQYMCGPYRMLWHMFGDVGLGYMLYDSPDLVQAVLDAWLALVKASLERIFSLIDLDSVHLLEDICFRSGLMISPAHFRRFLLPCYQELARFLKQFPSLIAFGVDSDGDVRPLIPLLLEGGVNTLMPFEVQAGCDVTQVRRQYGQCLIIKGGIDKRAVAAGPAAIDAELARVLPAFAAGGGYIVCLDHQAHPQIALSDYRYYIERVQAWQMRC